MHICFVLVVSLSLEWESRQSILIPAQPLERHMGIMAK